MTRINVNILIGYNLCVIFSEIYSLMILELNEVNPSKRLPNVITIILFLQSTGLFISHMINNNYYLNIRNFNLLAVIQNVITSIGIYYVLIVLMGAPLLKEKMNTLYLSVLLTILTTVPLLVFCKSNNNSNILLVLINRWKFENKVESFIILTSLSTLFGSWLGAFPIVLDWYQPWQEWPVTPCSGAIIANLFCNIICLCSIFYKNIKKIKHT